MGRHIVSLATLMKLVHMYVSRESSSHDQVDSPIRHLIQTIRPLCAWVGVNLHILRQPGSSFHVFPIPPLAPPLESTSFPPSTSLPLSNKPYRQRPRPNTHLLLHLLQRRPRGRLIRALILVRAEDLREVRGHEPPEDEVGVREREGAAAAGEGLAKFFMRG